MIRLSTLKSQKNVLSKLAVAAAIASLPACSSSSSKSSPPPGNDGGQTTADGGNNSSSGDGGTTGDGGSSTTGDGGTSNTDDGGLVGPTSGSFYAAATEGSTEYCDHVTNLDPAQVATIEQQDFGVWTIVDSCADGYAGWCSSTGGAFDVDKYYYGVNASAGQTDCESHGGTWTTAPAASSFWALATDTSGAPVHCDHYTNVQPGSLAGIEQQLIAAGFSIVDSCPSGYVGYCSRAESDDDVDDYVYAGDASSAQTSCEAAGDTWTGG